MEGKKTDNDKLVSCYVHSAVSTYLTQKKVGSRTQYNAKLEQKFGLRNT